MAERLGMVGMGLMGQSCIKNLRAAGFDIQGFDIDARRREGLRAQGGTPARWRGLARASRSGRGLAARLCPQPRILFVGINPSLRSAEVGHHFAGPGNPFWRLLHASGLVQEPLTYEDDVRLPEWGLALTNIVPRATREASEIRRAEFVEGRRALARLIRRLRPDVVAFVGATVYRAFFGPRVAGGAGPKPERIGEARVFVLPNPSGRNALYPGFRDKLVWFEALRRYAEREERGI